MYYELYLVNHVLWIMYCDLCIMNCEFWITECASACPGAQASPSAFKEVRSPGRTIGNEGNLSRRCGLQAAPFITRKHNRGCRRLACGQGASLACFSCTTHSTYEPIMSGVCRHHRLPNWQRRENNGWGHRRVITWLNFVIFFVVTKWEIDLFRPYMDDLVIFLVCFIKNHATQSLFVARLQKRD